MVSNIRTILVLSALSAPTLAQQEPAAPAEGEASEVAEIVVTGTLIRSRQDFKAASPIQTIDTAAIANAGAAQVQDLFKGLTANAGSQISNEQNALQGVSQFSLRGLGIGSTLTLINGRRAGLSPITDASGQLFTDANAFPVNYIGRVEVLTDGASATYGSEAVAGVVNIITRSNFEGFELTAEGRTSSNDSRQFGGAFGTAFDRGHIAVFTNYYRQSGNYRSDFDFIRARDTAPDGTPGAVYNSGQGSPGQYFRAVPAGTGFTNAGTAIADPDCLAAGGILAGTNCRYNFIDQRRIIPEENRLQIFAQGHYDITDTLKFSQEFSYSRNEIRDSLGGAVAAQSTFGGGYLVPASHPFNYFIANGATGIQYAGPAAFAAAQAAGTPLTAVDLIYRGRPLGKASDREGSESIVTTYSNQRMMLALDQQLGENWTLSASFVSANNRYARSQPRDYDIPLFQSSLLAGDFNPFGTAITDPALIGRDGTSVAENTPAELAAFAFTINDVGRVSQEVSELILSGDTPIKLPGGAISAAIGGQYRQLGYENTPDGRRQSGRNGRNEIEAATPFTRQKVYAAFGELALPILDNLHAQAALRYEDYGDRGGSTLDPKVALKWDITEQFAVRSSWGTSFQAPSIRQVSGAVGNSSVTDPALGAGAGTFNVSVFTSGSPDLESQSASNLNVGVLWNSSFGLSVSVDRYTYEYEDLILPGGDAQSIVNDVFAGLLPANRVLRDSSGQLRAVFTGFENRGSAELDGWDVNARWGLGRVTLDLASTIITRFESSEFAGLDGNGDLKGSRNFGNAFGSSPDFKLNGGATLDLGRHAFNLSGRYIGSYQDDQTAAAAEIDSQLTFDARYTLALEDFLSGSGTSLTIGAINLLDDDPPELAARPLYDTEVHDPRGRQFYLSLKHKF